MMLNGIGDHPDIDRMMRYGTLSRSVDYTCPCCGDEIHHRGVIYTDDFFGTCIGCENCIESVTASAVGNDYGLNIIDDETGEYICPCCDRELDEDDAVYFDRKGKPIGCKKCINEDEAAAYFD